MKHGKNNVRTLGWVAFFGGFGQDMIQPIYLYSRSAFTAFGLLRKSRVHP